MGFLVFAGKKLAALGCVGGGLFLGVPLGLMSMMRLEYNWLIFPGIAVVIMGFLAAVYLWRKADYEL